MRGVVAWIVLACGLAACAPRACSDEDNAIAADVELMLGEPGPIADDAARRVVARGRPAIAILETGLYAADARGRLQIVRALVDIGHPDAAPLLAHLAARDDDEQVRNAAKQGLETLGVSAGGRP